MAGSGTREDPWQLTTAPGTSAYQMWRDEAADPPALVCQVASTQLRYHLRAIEDLHAWLRHQGDWVDLGGADEQKPAPAGSVEAQTVGVLGGGLVVNVWRRGEGGGGRLALAYHRGV